MHDSFTTMRRISGQLFLNPFTQKMRCARERPTLQMRSHSNGTCWKHSILNETMSWDKWCKTFLNLFYLKDVIMFHSGPSTASSQQKCHPRRFFWAKNPGSLMFQSASPFGAEAHHACFSCCAIAVTSDSPVVVAMLQAGKPKSTNLGKEGWQTQDQNKSLHIWYQTGKQSLWGKWCSFFTDHIWEKKTFIKKNEDDDVYLKRIHRGYQVQCPVRWLASGHRSRQTLKKFRFTTAAHVPGFDAAGGSFPGGTWSRIWTLTNF